MSHFIPRLSSSTKWTEVPPDFLAKVRKVFETQFKAQAVEGEFIADGQIYPDEVLLRIGFIEEGRLKQINFEASMDAKKQPTDISAFEDSDLGTDVGDDDPVSNFAARRAMFAEQGTGADNEAEVADEKSTTLDRLFSCIDILGSLMEEYFGAESDIDAVDIPLHWKGYEFEGERIYLQYSTVNTRLEEEANKLLGLIGDALVNERDADEDAMVAAQVDSELAFEIQKAIRNGTYHGPGVEADEPN